MLPGPGLPMKKIRQPHIVRHFFGETFHEHRNVVRHRAQIFYQRLAAPADQDELKLQARRIQAARDVEHHA